VSLWVAEKRGKGENFERIRKRRPTPAEVEWGRSCYVRRKKKVVGEKIKQPLNKRWTRKGQSPRSQAQRGLKEERMPKAGQQAYGWGKSSGRKGKGQKKEKSGLKCSTGWSNQKGGRVHRKKRGMDARGGGGVGRFRNERRGTGEGAPPGLKGGKRTTKKGG